MVLTPSLPLACSDRNESWGGVLVYPGSWHSLLSYEDEQMLKRMLFTSSSQKVSEKDKMWTHHLPSPLGWFLERLPHWFLIGLGLSSICCFSLMGSCRLLPLSLWYWDSVTHGIGSPEQTIQTSVFYLLDHWGCSNYLSESLLSSRDEWNIVSSCPAREREIGSLDLCLRLIWGTSTLRWSPAVGLITQWGNLIMKELVILKNLLCTRHWTTHPFAPRGKY